jgi:hypothetical protein
VTRLVAVLVLLALALAVRYALACWLAPFRNCRRCGGMGRIRPTGTLRRHPRPKPCRRCRTTGRRLRAGRHVFNYLAATRAAARQAERQTKPTPTRATSARR